MTAYVIDGLTLAKRAGFEIDDERLARGREKLQSMLDSENTRDTDTRALMVYALSERGGADSKHVERLFAERNNLQPYGRTLLALTLSSLKMDQRASEVALAIERSATVENMTAHWDSKRTPILDFDEYDQTESTALSLKALSRIRPNSPLLPFAARWLVSDRENGAYWNSTRDTAFAIFGHIDYAKISDELTPAYDLEIYVNGESVLTQHVREAQSTQVFEFKRKGGSIAETNQIRVVKRGKGTLYFSSAVDYYTNDENIAAQGTADLNVTREYLRLKVEPDGYNLKWATTPLTEEIQSGDLIVVKLHLTGKAARHLMLEDPIPSGAEQIEAVGNLNLRYGEAN